MRLFCFSRIVTVRLVNCRNWHDKSLFVTNFLKNKSFGMKLTIPSNNVKIFLIKKASPKIVGLASYHQICKGKLKSALK